jgi:hypothetical protein
MRSKSPKLVSSSGAAGGLPAASRSVVTTGPRRVGPTKAVVLVPTPSRAQDCVEPRAILLNHEAAFAQRHRDRSARADEGGALRFHPGRHRDRQPRHCIHKLDRPEHPAIDVLDDTVKWRREDHGASAGTA